MENFPAIALTTMRNSYSGKKEQSILKHCSGYSRDSLLTSHLTDVRKAQGHPTTIFRKISVRKTI